MRSNLKTEELLYLSQRGKGGCSRLNLCILYARRPLHAAAVPMLLNFAFSVFCAVEMHRSRIAGFSRAEEA